MRALYTFLWPLSVLTFSSAVALADDASTQGIYTGLQLGYGSYKHNDEAGLNQDKDNTFVGGVLMGYRASEYFAGELNYQYLDATQMQLHGQSYRLNADQVSLLGKFLYPVTPKLAPYVKFGVSHWFGTENSRSVDGFSPVLAGGLQFTLNPAWQLGVMYQYTDSMGSSNDAAHSGVFFDASYRFGQPQHRAIPAVEILPPVITEVPEDIKEELLPTQIPSLMFAFDSTKITDTTALNEALEQMQSNDALIANIYGYASPIGNTAYNNALSKKRANAVRRYLIEHGIAANRLFSQGMGEYRQSGSPMAFGQRVDVHLKHK